MRFRTLVCVGLEGLFASKPAPTLDRIHTVKMWERACSRKRQPSHRQIQGYPNTCFTEARLASIQALSIAPQLRIR